MFNQIRRNLLTTASMNVLTYMIPLVVTPYFVRIVGTENFGALNIAQTLVQYLVLFVGFNLDVSIAGEIAVIKNDKARVRLLFWRTFYARMLLLLFAGIVFLFMLLFYRSDGATQELLLYNFIGLVGYAITPLWFYQGTEKFFRLFTFVAIGKLAFAIIIFAFVRKAGDFWIYSLALGLSQIITGVLALGYPVIREKMNPHRLSFKEVWTLIRQKYPLFKGGTLVNFCMTFNISLLGMILTLSDFGLYMAANKLILVLFTMFTLPLNQSLYPYLSRAITDNYQDAMEQVRRVMVPSLFYFAAIACLCLFVLARPLVLVMLGESFVAAILPFRIMIFSLLANLMANVVTMQILIKLNLLKIYGRVTLISALAGMLATLIFPYFIGLNGAAVAWLVAEYSLLIFSVVQLQASGMQVFEWRRFHPRHLINYWWAKRLPVS